MSILAIDFAAWLRCGSVLEQPEVVKELSEGMGEQPDVDAIIQNGVVCRVLSPDAFRKRLLEFFMEYNPPKTQHLNVFVSTWISRQSRFNSLLREKYGVDLHGESLHDVLLRYYLRTDVSQTGENIASLVSAHEKDERALAVRLREKYGVDHNGETTSSLIRTFFYRHCRDVFRSKVHLEAEAQALADQFAGAEEELNRTLIGRFGGNLNSV
eukprot:GDKH01006837.1.p1 GENE.GDKH01006837.1~~GDKH01006837.1.p1  ORF type:complete len:212 (-),score=33.44 GDKH01006837.1:613-1248(-)